MTIITCIICYACAVNRGSLKKWFVTEILNNGESSSEKGSRSTEDFDPCPNESMNIQVTDVIIRETETEHSN